MVSVRSVLVMVLAMMATFPAIGPCAQVSGQSQASCRALQLEDVEEYLKVNTPSAVVRRRIAECGVDFVYDKAAEDHLRTLGADADLRAEIARRRRGAIDIRSTPEGATVTVDGLRRGVTPVVIGDIVIGPHRVNLSRDGYLENATEVVVKPGETITLERTLTVARAPAPEVSAAGNGAAPSTGRAVRGKSKLPLILLGVGGAGAAGAIAAASSGGGSKDPVQQAPQCSFAISPTSYTAPASGGQQVVQVSVSPSNCSPQAWTASTTAAGVALSSSGGTGNGSLTVSVTANASTTPRSGTAAIASQTFTVNQDGAPPPTPCTYTFNPIDARDQGFFNYWNLEGGAVQNRTRVDVLVTPSNCSGTWSATSTVTWMTLSPSSGSNTNQTVQMSIDANPGACRSGQLRFTGGTTTLVVYVGQRRVNDPVGSYCGNP